MAESRAPCPNRADHILPAELCTNAFIGAPGDLADASSAQTGRIKHEGGRNRLSLRKCNANPGSRYVVDEAPKRGVLIDGYRPDAIGSHPLDRSALNHSFGSCDDIRSAMSQVAVKDVRAECIKYEATVDWSSSRISGEQPRNRPFQDTFR